MGFILQIFLAFFIASMVVSMIKSKKQQGQQLAEFQEKLAAYETITEEQILALDDEEIKEAITFHLLDKVDSDYDAALTDYNEAEKMFYTMYQLQLACVSPRGSINDFFVNAKELVKYAPIMLNELGLTEATAIFNDARALYLKYEEEYKRDIEEVVQELGEVEEEKTLFDYSNELKAIFLSETYTKEIANYVKTHIDQFVG